MQKHKQMRHGSRNSTLATGRRSIVSVAPNGGGSGGGAGARPGGKRGVAQFVPEKDRALAQVSMPCIQSQKLKRSQQWPNRRPVEFAEFSGSFGGIGGGYGIGSGGGGLGGSRTASASIVSHLMSGPWQQFAFDGSYAWRLRHSVKLAWIRGEERRASSSERGGSGL